MKTLTVEFKAGPYHRGIEAGDIVQSVDPGTKGKVVSTDGRRVVIEVLDEDGGYQVGDHVAGPNADMTLTSVS